MKRMLAIGAVMGIVGLAAGYTLGAMGGHHEAKVPTHMNLENAKFAPFNPEKPDGAHISVVWGNPKEGPSAFFLKIPAGHNAGTHKHTANFHGVVLDSSGSVHWDGTDENKSRRFSNDTYWYQAGGEWHGDRCDSTKDCMVLLIFDGPADVIPKD